MASKYFLQSSMIGLKYCSLRENIMIYLYPKNTATKESYIEEYRYLNIDISRNNIRFLRE